MNEKKTTKEILGTLFWTTIFIIFIILVFWDITFQEIIQHDKELNRYCIENGYDKKISYREKCDYYDCYIKIECKNKTTKEKGIIGGLKSTPCIKWDKWGDCTEHGYKIS